MEKIILTLSLQDDYTTGMSQLRKLCFPDDYVQEDDKDEFDERSSYVIIKDKDEIIGYGRLTPGPNAVFYTWTKGKAEIPHGEDSIDLGRCMVRLDYRRKNILKVICIAGLLVSKRKKFNHVNGAVVDGSSWLNMLEKIGLRKSGIIVRGKKDLIQPLSCNLQECHIDFDNLLSEISDELSINGISLDVKL